MRDKPVVIDLFCGAGGESQGIHWAMGDNIKLFAVNHWPQACETHAYNFPEDECICQDIASVIPPKLVPGGHAALLWASPECTHFSVARGAKPCDAQSRCTAWDIVRWVTSIQIDRVIVENVPEFLSWGPLDENNRPIEALKGQYFLSWFEAMCRCGYKGEWRFLTAADYGAPTIRKRLFVQFSRTGIVWPSVTNTEDADMFTKRWVPASTCIDFTQPKKSILHRERPLNPATIEKVCNGIKRFWGKDKCEPFLARYNGGANRVHSLAAPMPTLDCSNRYALVEPIVFGYYGNATFTPVSKPMPTVPCANVLSLLEAIPCRDGKIVDVSLRMLTVDELKLAQGFPKSYEFTGTKADQLRQIGNAVVPNVAEALVREGA